MEQHVNKPRRGFTQAARDAARAARLRNAELKSQTNEIDVFVVRADLAVAFRWEIRKFGGVVLERSIDTFPSAGVARRAGQTALGRS